MCSVRLIIAGNDTANCKRFNRRLYHKNAFDRPIVIFQSVYVDQSQSRTSSIIDFESNKESTRPHKEYNHNPQSNNKPYKHNT